MEMITAKKGGGEGFSMENISEKKMNQERDRDTDEYQKNSGRRGEAEQRSAISMWLQKSLVR